MPPTTKQEHHQCSTGLHQGDQKIKNFPTKPASGGIPIRLNRIATMATDRHRGNCGSARVVGDLFALHRIAQERDNGERARFMNR